jgi:hypothetical protein
VKRFGVISLLALGLAVSAAPAAPNVYLMFRTPSGNIGCGYASDGGGSLRCDIRTGLKPKPPKPPRCDLDWGDSYELGTMGRATVTCHGDTTLDPRSRVLKYGAKWSRGGFTCTSKLAGLRCSNRSRHGFFLSKRHSFRF